MKKALYIIYFTSFIVGQVAPKDIYISSINVDGNIMTSENTIIFTAGLREGNSISPSEFPRAVKRLWQLGLFQDIQIILDDETPDGVSLTILVEENFVLGSLHFNGNKKIKNKKFEEELLLSTGQRIKPNTPHETAEKIKALYIEKGFLNVDINTELIIPEDKSKLFDGKAEGLIRDIVYNIQENNKVKIGDIIFEGNDSFSDLRLRWKMKETKQQRWYLFWRSAFDEKKYNDDLNIISQFYRNKGYRDFRIISDSMVLNETKKKLDFVLKIEEGPKYKYRNISWEGMSLFDESILNQVIYIMKKNLILQFLIEPKDYIWIVDIYIVVLSLRSNRLVMIH